MRNPCRNSGKIESTPPHRISYYFITIPRSAFQSQHSTAYRKSNRQERATRRHKEIKEQHPWTQLNINPLSLFSSPHAFPRLPYLYIIITIQAHLGNKQLCHYLPWEGKEWHIYKKRSYRRIKSQRTNPIRKWSPTFHSRSIHPLQ